nr:hypothetical protein Iba_chr13fCG9200 [Ipomoea batatas]
MQKEIYASLAARLEDFTLESQQIPLDHENLNSARGALARALEAALVDLEGEDEEPGRLAPWLGHLRMHWWTWKGPPVCMINMPPLLVQRRRSARLTKRGGWSTPNPSKRHLVYLVRRHGRLVHNLGRLYAHFDCAVRPRLTKCLKKHGRPASREKGDWLAPNLL